MKKRYLYSMIFVLVWSYSGFAQNSDTFRSAFLSDSKAYFSDASIKEDGTLEIQAIDSVYRSIDVVKKGLILENALKNWHGEMIFVYSGYMREIWRRDIKTGFVSQVGIWNLNNPELSKHQQRTLETTKKHPWFFYAGGQSNFNEQIFNLMLSTRIGFFLLKDRWDLALSNSLGIFTSKASESDSTGEGSSSVSEELGLLSKVYFPIKLEKYKLSPYVGAGISLAGTGDFDEFETYCRTMCLVGVSWYIGPGSLDFGTQVNLNFREPIQCNFSLSLGYTFLF